MGDTFAVMRTLAETSPRSALIVGAGYVGLEMAEALVARGLVVTQIEQFAEVLPTVDSELGELEHQELTGHGVEVHCSIRVTGVARASKEASGWLEVRTSDEEGERFGFCRPGPHRRSRRATRHQAGRKRRRRFRNWECGDELRPSDRDEPVPDVFAAGDCVTTHHRPYLGVTYLPLGTTAHKQGRVAGENALAGSREFAGSLGTQVVKIFDIATAHTGLHDHEARAAGFDPVTIPHQADDHKASSAPAA